MPTVGGGPCLPLSPTLIGAPFAKSRIAWRPDAEEFRISSGVQHQPRVSTIRQGNLRRPSSGLSLQIAVRCQSEVYCGWNVVVVRLMEIPKMPAGLRKGVRVRVFACVCGSVCWFWPPETRMVARWSPASCCCFDRPTSATEAHGMVSVSKRNRSSGASCSTGIVLPSSAWLLSEWCLDGGHITQPMGCPPKHDSLPDAVVIILSV
jgi:hypothetical protein|mmetsp:Transcript_50111/g.83923  ORF Transcript_50111/g.83923 Transcript_50111/m.83923 type:complete len:206 (-) Transcript_50111:424-1041(-)